MRLKNLKSVFSKNWVLTLLLFALIGVSGGLLFPRYFLSETKAGTGQFTETFETTDKKDFTNTTAFWNPRLGNVTMGSQSDSSFTWAFTKPRPQGHQIEDLAIVTTQIALAVTRDGQLLRTSDAGATWGNITPMYPGGELRGVHAIDGSTWAWAVGVASNGDGYVIKSTNAGSSWAYVGLLSSVLVPNDVYFKDNLNGVIVGDNGKIDTTGDGGSTWTARTSNTTYNLNAVSGLAGSTYYYAAGGGTTGQAVFLRSTTSGQTWYVRTLPSGLTNPLYAVAMNGQTAVLTVGVDGAYFWNGSTLTKTAATPGTPPYYSVCGGGSYSTTTFWVGDGYGGVHKTTNNGTNFTSAYTFTSEGFTFPVRAISFQYYLSVGMLGGDSGSIAYTSDGGANWTSRSTHITDKDVNAISCLDDQNCFAVGNLNILKTADGGSTWTKTSTATNNYGVLYYASDSAFMFGATGGIYKTVNGGSLWALSNTGTSGESFYKMVTVPGEPGKFWLAGSTGYQSGTGVIYYSADGGASWTSQTLPITSPIMSVAMVKDPDTGNLVGYAVARGGQIIKTTDGGANWESQTSNTSDVLSDIYCANKNYCFVSKETCSLANSYMYTTTGGPTWSQLTLASGGSCPYYHVAGLDQKSVMFSGTNSLQYTINGGTNWSIIKTTDPTLPAKVKGLDYLNAVKLIGVASDSSVYESGNIITLTSPYLNSSKDVVSTEVSDVAEDITAATLTATATLNSQTITYYLSADGGAHWEEVTSGVEHTFTNVGQDLRWKATLTSTSTVVTPILSNIVIDYTYGSAAAAITAIELDPALDFTRFASYQALATVQGAPTSMSVDVTGINGDITVPPMYWQYSVDGTPHGDTVTKAMSYDSGVGKWRSANIWPDDIYPQIYFADESITWNNAPTDASVWRRNYHILKYTNPFTMVGDMNFYIELNVVPVSASNPSVLYVYLVGKDQNISTYFNSDWRTKPQTVLVDTIGPAESPHHTHSANSAHHLIALKPNSDGTIGTNNVDISSNFYVVLYEESVRSSLGWLLRYQGTSLCNNSANWYTADRPGTNLWRTPVHVAGCPDAHIHVARRDPSHLDGVKAVVSGTFGSVITEEQSFYFGPLSNVAPNATNFTSPVAGNVYNGGGTNQVSVSWNPATDPNGDSLLYSVYLLNASDVQVATLVENTSNLSFTWDISGISDGTYKLKGVITEDKASPLSTNFYTAGYFYIQRVNPIYTLSSISLTTNGVNSPEANSGDQVSLSFTATGALVSTPTVSMYSGGVPVTNTVTVNNVSGNDWLAQYSVSLSDTDGNVTFEISAGDLAETYTLTTDDTYIDVVTSGGSTRPMITSVSLNGGNPISLFEGNMYNNVSCAVELFDYQGCGNVTSVSAKLYRTGVGSSCTADLNNCYLEASATCTEVYGQCAGGADMDDVYQCNFGSVAFFAEPTDTGSIYATDDWTCEAYAADSVGAGDPETDVEELSSLNGVEISGNLMFPQLDQGQNTGASPLLTTIENTGNIATDIEVSGNDWMCGMSGTLPVGNLKYSITTFDYNTDGSALTSTPYRLEFDMPKPTVSRYEDPVTADLYWGIAAPVDVSGYCSGQVIISSLPN